MRVPVLIVCLAGCTSAAHPPAPAIRQPIEVHDGTAVTARVSPGHPCRALVDGTELLIGGRPLLAQLGNTRWTGEDLANGTTLKKNDEPIARIQAGELYDAAGIPVLRVNESGEISNATGQITRRAIPTAGPVTAVRIGDLTITGLPGGPDDVRLAAMLTAPGVSAELRALAACHYLLSEPSEPSTVPQPPSP